MAKADDTSSTRAMWMPWDEAVECTGSIEALLQHLRERRILVARHHGLYYWPSGKARGEPGQPGNIEPDWWPDARVDVTGRVIFKRPLLHRGFFVGAPAAGPPIVEEVFAVGIEIERAAAFQYSQRA